MSEQETPTLDATSRIIQTPLIPNRPRLRFIEGAGEGAAGDGEEEGQGESGNDEGSAESGAGEDALGDAGKQALDRMKAERTKAIKDAKAATARAEAAEAALANKDKPADEVALDAARAEAKAEAIAASNLKLAKSALRLAAKGVLADPADAALYIDASTFEVDDEGEVDSDAVTAAIDELLTRKPHLAAGKQTRFDGDADQGARGKETGPAQWTQADLDRADREGRSDDIAEARAKGLLNKVLGAYQLSGYGLRQRTPVFSQEGSRVRWSEGCQPRLPGRDQERGRHRSHSLHLASHHRHLRQERHEHQLRDAH